MNIPRCSPTRATKSTRITWCAAGDGAGAGAGGNSKTKKKPKNKLKRKKKSFIIQPADGFIDQPLWQESEAGSVLIGTRRARRRCRQMSDHWRKIMALGGIDGEEVTTSMIYNQHTLHHAFFLFC